MLGEFYDYCVVDERLSSRVAKDYWKIVRRFLGFCDFKVSRDAVRRYLVLYLDRSPKTYNNQLDGLRCFFNRFLKQPCFMEGFKKAYVPIFERELPSNKQVRRGFYGLTSDLERAVYLFYATTGLRRSEALGLRVSDVDFSWRLVRPRHDTRTKKAGVTFYNEECEKYLESYLSAGKVKDRLFVIGFRPFQRIWEKASREASFRITPQVLRVWFATEMGELGVPDRYVDIFQGRAPRTVLAKYYTGKGLDRLKRIYDKAGLKVLG